MCHVSSPPVHPFVSKIPTLLILINAWQRQKHCDEVHPYSKQRDAALLGLVKAEDSYMPVLGHSRSSLPSAGGINFV